MHGAVHGDDGAGGDAGEHAVRTGGDLLDVVVVATHRQMTSLLAASSAGELAVLAAVPANGASVSGRRAHSVSGNPPSMILRAIGAPWLPSPMNPARGRGA